MSCAEHFHRAATDGSRDNRWKCHHTIMAKACGARFAGTAIDTGLPPDITPFLFRRPANGADSHGERT